MFHLRVYDNFHYGDESEAYNYGQFATYEEAVIGAKAIVDEFMEWNWRENIRPDQLGALFSLYGEDPIILPSDPGENGSFSAYKYADEAAESACKKLQKNPYTNENYFSIFYPPEKPSDTPL